MKNWLYFPFCILIFGFSNSAFSYDDAFWQKIAKRPDVKITVENGVKTAHFSGGVTISGEGLGIDNSEHGAVGCAWRFYVEIRNSLEICPPPHEGEFKQALDYAIGKMNDFIVINSLSPVTRSELEGQISKKLLKLKEQASKVPEEKLQKECNEGFAAQYQKRVMSKPIEEFKKSVDAMLSIPRPPVINPCF